MKKILILMMVFMALSLLFVGAVASANVKEDKKLAYFKVLNAEGKNLAKKYQRFEFGNNIISIEAQKKDLDKLKKNKNIKFIEDVQVYEPLSFAVDPLTMKIPGSEDTGITDTKRGCKLSDYGLPRINYGIKYMYEDMSLVNPSGGRNVRVAVIDTGANISHADISRRVVLCKDLTVFPAVDSCEDSLAPYGHGTLVASIIAADGGADDIGMYGMAPEAQLLIYKVCRGNYCSDDSIARGITDAVNNNANIISISLGGSALTGNLKNAIDYATDNNVLVVAAAGNYFGSNNVDTIIYPSAYYRIASVGAIDSNYNPWINSAAGTNDGDYMREEREVELAAPGVLIVAANSQGCYGYATGTSVAAPHVSGLAAKLWDGNAANTRVNMWKSAYMHDLYTAGDDTITGFGMPTINIQDAEFPFAKTINTKNTLPRRR